MSEEPETGPSGAQRAAIFLLSLDRRSAAGLMKHIEQDVVAEIAEAMTQLDVSASDEKRVDELYLDLARGLHGHSPVRSQDMGELADMLRASFGDERAQAVVRQIEERRLQERPFRVLEAEPADVIARVLGRESGPVAALVLAHFDPRLSGAVLSGLAPERALEIVQRMPAIVPPPFDTLRAIASELESQARLAALEPQPPDTARRLRTIAEMLSQSAGPLNKSVMDGLRENNEEMAKEIQEYMFTWDDLATLDKRGMQKILGAVNTTTLSMALKGSPPAVEANVMSNLSTRSRAMVQEERELAGAVPMAQVQAARVEILTSVRTLLESGELKAAHGGEELVS